MLSSIFNYKGLFTVGFAAETDNPEKNALEKLKEKKLNMICLNDVTKEGAGFNTDTNIITVYTKTGRKIEFPKLSKIDAAEKIIGLIEEEICVI